MTRWICAIACASSVLFAHAAHAEKAGAGTPQPAGLARIHPGSGPASCSPLRSDPGGADNPAALRRLEAHATDVSALLQLAGCYERTGKTASAWMLFRKAASAARLTGASDRASRALARAQALEPTLSYLSIVTWRGQEVNVRRDGSVLDTAVLGTALPVDPGTHVVTASAPGKRGWSTTVAVGAAADHVTVSIPILADDPRQLPRHARELPAPPTRAKTEPNRPGSTQRFIGIVSAGLGLAGIATGSVFGVQAASSWSEAKSNCNPYPYCGAAGQRLAKAAERSGTVSTAAFIAGGVGLLAGAILWFTAPREPTESDTSLQLGPSSVTGSF